MPSAARGDQVAVSLGGQRGQAGRRVAGMAEAGRAVQRAGRADQVA
jgi:hypothetical protein